ncbi:hypothetical protein [Dyella subtropica]|uniref:hypothetical protein n=1 Tax=Dyella subtropica TaxID=2992127 RepID=UPI002254907D|nr:hypothetical protein [Dyella subtropica]
MRYPLLFAVALALGRASTAFAAEPSAQPIRAMDALIGHWQCDGVFPASGKTIASTMRFEADLGGNAVLKHHDDISPPASYHAVEAWGYDAKAQRFNATILDSFGGARRFSSDGWNGDTLTWTSAPELQPAQRFVYVRKDASTLTVDWDIMREGHFVVGDTLICKRQ